MRDSDRAIWLVIGAALCALGGSTINAHGFHLYVDLALSVLGLVALAGGLYVLLAALFQWPLPNSAPVLTADQQMIVNGLRHLIEDGHDLLTFIESPDGGRYSSAYTEWVQRSELFVETHLTGGHGVKFRSTLGLERLADEYEGAGLYMRRYLIRLEGFVEEMKGRA